MRKRERKKENEKQADKTTYDERKSVGRRGVGEKGVREIERVRKTRERTNVKNVEEKKLLTGHDKNNNDHKLDVYDRRRRHGDK